MEKTKKNNIEGFAVDVDNNLLCVFIFFSIILVFFWIVNKNLRLIDTSYANSLCKDMCDLVWL